MLLQCLSNTASVTEVIIIGYSITHDMVCTEYKVLSQSSTVVSLSFCTEYQCIGYVQYTEATNSQWYEGVAMRKDMLEVVQRINQDLSSCKLHISNTKQVHCTPGTDYNAHTVSEKWPPTQQRNTLTCKTKATQYTIS